MKFLKEDIFQGKSPVDIARSFSREDIYNDKLMHDFWSYVKEYSKTHPVNEPKDLEECKLDISEDEITCLDDTTTDFDPSDYDDAWQVYIYSPGDIMGYKKYTNKPGIIYVDTDDSIRGYFREKDLEQHFTDDNEILFSFYYYVNNTDDWDYLEENKKIQPNKKLLKEDYGQSMDLNEFDSQARGRFETYYKVVMEIKENYTDSNTRLQTELFAFEDAAKDYYNKLLKDIEDEKYNWFWVTVTLNEVRVNLSEEELEEKTIYEEDEEEEEVIEDDTIIDDEE